MYFRNAPQVPNFKNTYELWTTWISPYIITTNWRLYIAIFHKYCCYTKHGGIKARLTLHIYGGILLICQNTPMQVNGAWVKRYCLLCSKPYNTLHSCHNFPAGSRQAARGARICETSLLKCSWMFTSEWNTHLSFQRVPLKSHKKYLTHTLKDMIFIIHWNFKSS